MNDRRRVDPDRLAEAVRFATEHHGDQVRKDDAATPYVSHLMAVAALVLEDGGSEDQAVAALLHDVVEDCPGVTVEIVAEAFGDPVAAIVAGCTDTDPNVEDGPRPSWQIRKDRYLAHLIDAPDDVLLVSNADKLHNLSSLVADVETAASPTEALERFNRPDRVLWYHEQLAAIFEARRPQARNARRYQRQLATLRELLDTTT